MKVQLSLYDVPTENCDVHTEVEICDASGHAANEYCALVDGNTTHNVGLLNISRAFPTVGIVVLDQSYVVPNDSLRQGITRRSRRMWTRSMSRAISTTRMICQKKKNRSRMRTSSPTRTTKIRPNRIYGTRIPV